MRSTYGEYGLLGCAMAWLRYVLAGLASVLMCLVYTTLHYFARCASQFFAFERGFVDASAYYEAAPSTVRYGVAFGTREWHRRDQRVVSLTVQSR